MYASAQCTRSHLKTCGCQSTYGTMELLSFRSARWWMIERSSPRRILIVEAMQEILKSLQSFFEDWQWGEFPSLERLAEAMDPVAWTLVILPCWRSGLVSTSLWAPVSFFCTPMMSSGHRSCCWLGLKQDPGRLSPVAIISRIGAEATLGFIGLWGSDPNQRVALSLEWHPGGPVTAFKPTKRFSALSMPCARLSAARIGKSRIPYAFAARCWSTSWVPCVIWNRMSMMIRRSCASVAIRRRWKGVWGLSVRCAGSCRMNQPCRRKDRWLRWSQSNFRR